jgi:hypothetical protein
MPRNYRDCLDARQKCSPKAVVFLLVYKMDLVTEDRVALPECCMRRLQAESNAVSITVFDTSIGIHDEMLYKVHRTPTVSRTFFPLLPSLSLPPLPFHSAWMG